MIILRHLVKPSFPKFITIRHRFESVKREIEQWPVAIRNSKWIRAFPVFRSCLLSNGRKPTKPQKRVCKFPRNSQRDRFFLPLARPSEVLLTLEHPHFTIHSTIRVFVSDLMHSLRYYKALGAAKFGFLQISKQRQSIFGASFSKKMEAVMGTELGVVRPATDAHLEEAIGAIKMGKVIAVPTDTLYGFACDAW